MAKRTRNALIVGGVILAAVAIKVATIDWSHRGGKTCIERGVAYYKEIGSFPTLSTGKSADAEIREMCGRNDNLFPNNK